MTVDESSNNTCNVNTNNNHDNTNESNNGKKINDTDENNQFSIINNLKQWGRSPIPPTTLATLITALHFRPFHPMPLLFPPILLMTSYINLQDLPRESAGLSAAWSGLYILMAKRGKNNLCQGIKARLKRRFGARGLTRAAAMGVAATNLVSGGMIYVLDREPKNGSVL